MFAASPHNLPGAAPYSFPSQNNHHSGFTGWQFLPFWPHRTLTSWVSGDDEWSLTQLDDRPWAQPDDCDDEWSGT